MELSYVAIYHPGFSETILYGAAACRTIEDVTKMADFCDRNGLRYVNGKLYDPDELLAHARQELRAT